MVCERMYGKSLNASFSFRTQPRQISLSQGCRSAPTDLGRNEQVGLDVVLDTRLYSANRRHLPAVVEPLLRCSSCFENLCVSHS